MANFTTFAPILGTNLTNNSVVTNPKVTIDYLDFAVSGILITSVGLAGLIANVVCLLVLHRPAMKVGRQVSQNLLSLCKLRHFLIF